DMISGKSIVMKSEINIKRVSIGSPAIADFILLSPKEIYIKGKAAGITNMILWQDGKVTTIYDIEVKYDLSRLKEKLYQILPDEKEIQVMSTNNSLTLSGRVSSAANLSQALALAKSYAPKGNVSNLLTVGGTHQVMLEVKIAEISRSVGRDLGINLGNVSEIGNMTVQLLSNFGASVTPAFDGLLQYTGGDTTWSMLINALKNNGLIRILAEPNLVALSGHTASFLAGGEYPIPVPNEDGITVSFKKFGVGISFTPNVLNKDKINIKVNSGVSELDFSTAVQFSGYVVPGLSSRKAETTVELADGQSFVIAGLLSESIRENVQKFPFLGDIPVLGILFKSKSFLKSETELVIIVTPRFIKPINKETQPAPSDYYSEPDDMEFYFDIEKPAEQSSKEGSIDKNMDGQFGHSFEE
ncbi:MAG: type II and III secretion system protein family protein, partial [Desulfobacula sp.]|nr:type II and III secretion system protein family protein [Desulfobacula sp.]